ncbi:class I SAM-dependent methyltransferase [uncultured Clostridium sp.]|uniref:class I SAM-dependent methyltransferase n=1 Tax=uncultured Clostridium sp. TaxID=59620 RepID=UPI00263934B4|nr:class I SAM-dependent methyltransferase [uncultured Clostridium sp.]
MDIRLKFNEDALNYEKYRPGYPKELFEELINYAQLDKSSKVIEIGCGTGQATLPILKIGCNVMAIELGNNLATYTKEKFKRYDNFKIINDDFINYNIEENKFDLVYCATAFHWLPIEEKYKKIKNILKKDGVLAIFWNHPFVSRNNDITNVKSKEIYDKYKPSKEKAIEFSQKDCKKYIEELKNFGFKEVISKVYYRKRTLTSEEYIGLINTYSDHRALEEKIKYNFEKDMREAIDSVGGKINIYDTIDLYLAK